MLEGLQANEEWVNLKRAVKGNIRMELSMRKVDKGGGSLIEKGGAKRRPLRRVRLAHR
jgi:hypothetical protein